MCFSARPRTIDLLLPAERPGDLDLVPGLDLAVRLRGLAADVDLAGLAGLLRLGAGLEQAGDVQPQVEAHGQIITVRQIWWTGRICRSAEASRPELSGQALSQLLETDRTLLRAQRVDRIERAARRAGSQVATRAMAASRAATAA